MNASLVLMLGVALLLVRPWVHKPPQQTKWYTWLSLATAGALLIQPVVAALKWVGGLVGV